MTISLREMPMITVEQKNRFREAALEVEKQRDDNDRLVVELAEKLRECASELGWVMSKASDEKLRPTHEMAVLLSECFDLVEKVVEGGES